MEAIQNWWEFSRLRDWIYEVKYFFQRLFRGYSDPEVFGCYSYLAKFIYPRIKAFVESDKHGTPVIMFSDPQKIEHSDEEYKEAEKNWQEVLNKILFAFEWILYDDLNLSKKEMKAFEEKYGDIHEEKEEYKRENSFFKDDFYFNTKLYEELNEKCQEGLELFGKYFRNLWD